MAVQDIGSYLQDKIIDLDEYDSQCTFFRMPDVMDRIFLDNDGEYKKILTFRGKADEIYLSYTHSKNALDSGNAAYAKKPKTNETLLQAYEFYTNAIVAARTPNCGGGGDLSMAYANRAQILFEFECFKESYDDCCFAVEYSSRELLLAKVTVRQAHCAFRLNDLSLTEKHLNDIRNMTLRGDLAKNVEQLKAQFEEAKRGASGRQVQPHSSKGAHKKAERKNVVEDKKIKYKIIESEQSITGTSMIATEDISKNEVIFTDLAFGLPTENYKAYCRVCGKTLLVNYPCNDCHSCAYCSYECRNKDLPIHQYICRAYYYDIFGNEYVKRALQITTKYLPQVLPKIRHLRSANDIWYHLNVAKGVKKASNDQTENLLEGTDYYKILGIESKYDTFDVYTKAKLIEDVGSFLYYLKEHTTFFALFKETSTPLEDWYIIVATLLLRHSCVRDIVPNCFGVVTIPKRAPYLKTFDTPYSIKKGCLHNVDFASVPYYSTLANKCNHSCAPSGIVGVYDFEAIAYAAKDIRAGEEITVSCRCEYTLGPLNIRSQFFEKNIGGPPSCNCEICEVQRKNASEDKFMGHHLSFRCTNQRCRELCLPKRGVLPELDIECWHAYHTPDFWLTLWEDHISEPIKCTKCKTELDHLASMKKLKQLAETPCNQTLKTMLKIYKKTSEDLPNFNIMRMLTAKIVSDFCVEVHIRGLGKLSPAQFKMIDEMNKCFLEIIMKLCEYRPIVWLVHIGIVWDTIAAGRVKYTEAETSNVVENLHFLPKELKALFLRYYDEFVNPK